MYSKSSSDITRRRFLLVSALGSISVAVGPLVFSAYGTDEAPRQLTMGTILIRNPAFLLSTESNQPVLMATTADGKRLRYQMDEEGVFLWGSVPKAEDYLQGKVLTVRSILDLAVKKYGNGIDSSVRDEAFAFVKQAFEAGILVDPQTKMYVDYNPVRR